MAMIALGARELVCAGFSGGRADHALGVLYDLAEVSGRARSVRLLGEGFVAHFLAPSTWKARLRPGATVSILALGGAATGVTLKGFQFPLTNAKLAPSSLGLSNRAKRAEVGVSFKRGRLVVWELSL